MTSAATLHVFVNPLVVWIWLGGGVVGVGALFAIWPDRRRVPVAAAVPVALGAVMPQIREPMPDSAAPSVQVEEA